MAATLFADLQRKIAAAQTVTGYDDLVHGLKHPSRMDDPTLFPGEDLSRSTERLSGISDVRGARNCDMSAPEKTTVKTFGASIEVTGKVSARLVAGAACAALLLRWAVPVILAIAVLIKSLQ